MARVFDAAVPFLRGALMDSDDGYRFTPREASGPELKVLVLPRVRPGAGDPATTDPCFTCPAVCGIPVHTNIASSHCDAAIPTFQRLEKRHLQLI